MLVTIDATLQEIKEVLRQRECLASVDLECQEEYDARRAFKSPAQSNQAPLRRITVLRNGKWVSLSGCIDELENGVEYRARGVNNATDKMQEKRLMFVDTHNNPMYEDNDDVVQRLVYGDPMHHALYLGKVDNPAYSWRWCVPPSASELSVIKRDRNACWLYLLRLLLQNYCAQLVKI